MTVRGDPWGVRVDRAPFCDTFPPEGRRVSSQVLLRTVCLVLPAFALPCLLPVSPSAGPRGWTVREGSSGMYMRV